MLFRLYGQRTEIIIDRRRDIEVYAALSAAGFAPHFYGGFTNGRIEEWMDVRPLLPEEMTMTAPVDFQRLIAVELAKMHAINMPGSRAPVLWDTLDRWGAIASEVRFVDDETKAQLLQDIDLPAVGRMHFFAVFSVDYRLSLDSLGTAVAPFAAPVS